jgi:hypothetical protein
MYSFWYGDVPYPLSLKPSEPDGRTIHPGCISKFDVLMVRRNTTEYAKEKRGEEIFLSLTADFIGRPRLLDENPDLPRFKTGHFKPELVDKNNPSLGFKEYSIKIRVSAEGVPAIDKKFNVFFCRDLSEDAVQIWKADDIEIGGGNLGPEAAEELENCNSIAELSDLLCNRLLRSKTSFLNLLKRIKEAENKDISATKTLDKNQ